MKRTNYARWKSHRKGKGFSLVELVVVIIIIAILAVAVFAGGAAVIAKARTERAVSDLNNFERAISTYMFEKTKMVKMDYSSGKAKFDQIADDINDGLPQEYQLDKTVSIPATGAISSDITGQIAYVSDKKDPWGNNYWLLMDTTNRNTGSSEYFITVMSAGKNGKANVGGLLDGDDIFLLNQYSNGEVATKIYKMQEDTTDGTGSPLTKGETALTPITGLPAPRNIGENAKDVAHVHSWVVDSQTAATCTAAGVQHRRCTACGETEDVNLPAVGHNLTWTTTKQATCTENGMKRGSCTRCSYSTTQTIASPGHHTYGGWKIDIAATCTQAGERSRVCSVCSHKETEPIPTSGSHSWGEWVTETAATCVAGGTEKHTCTRSGCGASETRATDPLGHNWKSVTKAATCTEAGYTQDECQRSGCSATKNKTTIVALGHNYGSWATVTAATCTTPGERSQTCSVCGHKKTEPIPTTGSHSWSEWTTDTPATCTSAGTEKRSCTREGCGESESRETSPLGHDWLSVTVPPTDTTVGYTQDECQRTGCGATQNRIETPAHAFLTFTSPSAFSISIRYNYKGWNGTLEYSTNMSAWAVWDGKSPISAVSGSDGYSLYLRGTNNSKIMKSSFYYWQISGNNVQCNGNIETLLDYQTVLSGNHPTMELSCFYSMFEGCTSLTTAPKLPATTLTTACYMDMFKGCTSLTTAPDLPATTLATQCYYGMFEGCTSLTTAPELPATTLTPSCYYSMFEGCTSLTTAPELPATSLKSDCYALMFDGCTSLTTAPELPATTLSDDCYHQMFQGCTSLTTAPDLPATTLEECYSCYVGMFFGCTSLTTAPELPATTLEQYCYASMFAGCTSLTTVPEIPATSFPLACCQNMFQGCTSIKLSATQTGEYTQPYRIPKSGTSANASNSLSGMFSGTGGTFTGTPDFYTIYYLSYSNSIVG